MAISSMAHVSTETFHERVEWWRERLGTPELCRQKVQDEMLDEIHFMLRELLERIPAKKDNGL